MKKDGYKMVKDDVMGHSDVPDYLSEHGLSKHTSLPSYMLQ